MLYCFSNPEKVIMKTIRYFLNCLFVALLTLPTQGRAQDIDLYSAAASVTGASLPNVLFIMDNSANWNASAPACTYYDGTSPSLGSTAGGIEQCALVNAINALPFQANGNPVVNVGIMVYNKSSIGYGCNSSGTGGCLMVPLAPMSSANQTTLINTIKAWSGTSQQANNEATAQAMQEAWAYYAGKTGMSGTDYTSPLTGCPKNYVVFIGNAVGSSSSPGDASSTPGTQLTTTITGNAALTSAQVTTLSSTITIPSGTYGTSTFSCSPSYTMPTHSNVSGLYADEWARYMNSTDLVTGIMPGTKKITTYTIGVLGSACKPDYPALLESMARSGGGKYFSTGTAFDIQQAITRILNEVQAVNSVFSSSSLPVSVNAQGTYLNQIYMGMFRPDSGGQPMWFGNLKQYQFIYDPTTKTLQLADATGTPAISAAGTGFMSPNAASFWDCTSSGNTSFYNVSPYNVLPACNPAEPTNGFWVNRINGVAGAYDLPDGEMVEKGGAAMVMRLANLTNNYGAAPGSTTNPRNLYTYCPSGSACGGTSTLLSADAFDPSNAAITDAMLGTGSRAVSSITGVTSAVTTSNVTTLTSSGGTSISIIALSKAGSTVTATISTTDMAKIAVGSILKVATGASKYDCTPSCTVSAILSGTQFTYTNAGGGGTPNLAACPAANPSGCAAILSNLVQVTPAVAPSPFPVPGQLVTFSSCTTSTLTGLNGTVGTITSVTSTTFTVGTSVSVGGSDTTCKYTPNTATVTSTAHGFPNGASITIAGATPAGYDGTWTITVVDANTFTYQYSSPAPLASPATLSSATATSSTTRTNLTEWVRGYDYLNDEFGPGSPVNIRPYVHGDVLHSRPVVINYGTGTGVVVFYGANDGVYRAVNGNQTSAIGTTPAGGELWGFIPSEFYGKLKRLHDNSPVILFPSTTTGIIPAPTLKDYFTDGPTGLYQLINSSGGTQTAYIYLTMRRGGRFIYALDVTTPTAPKFLWKHSNADTGFSELGQTWSQPKVAMVKGYANPVLIFAGGYDTAEDAEPPTADTMGRGIYILDATTGALVWKATYGASLSCPDASAACTLPNMIYSIPSDITLMDRDSDGFIDRMYVGDVGGNIWRVDLEPTAGNLPANWQVEKFAALGCNTGPCAGGVTPRKFLYAPEVISVSGYDAVFAGSGDREHPLYANPPIYTDPTTYPQASYNVVNRIYMLKDTLTGSDGSGMVPITELTGSTANLFDATATTYPGTLDGYYITLKTGEKCVNAPLVVAGYVYFGTNKPDKPSTNVNQCEDPLGEAASYQLSPFSGAYSRGEWDSGGLPPSPVAGVVNIVDPSTGKTIQVPFCIGCGVGDEGQSQQNGNSTCNTSALAACSPPINVSTSRKRTYWYMQND